MEKKQYRRKCSGQFNKERTQGALLRRGVFFVWKYERAYAIIISRYFIHINKSG